MPNELDVTNLEPQQPAQTPAAPPPGQDEHGRDLEGMRRAAEAVFAERAEGEGRPAPARPRDASGRFLPKANEQPAAPPEPTLDPVWAEVARAEGLSDADIAAAKTEQDIRNRIGLSRIETLQRLGIDPVEFASYRQWRQGEQQPTETLSSPTVQQTPQTPQLLADLQIDIPEDDLSPEVVKPLKAVTEYANKVKATYAAELQKVQQELAALKGQLQQSAEARQEADRAARTAEQFDTMASKVPGFAEHFGGKPSELAALAAASNMRDPKVRRLMAWDIEHYQPALEKYEGILGQGNPRAQELALQAAWKSAGLDQKHQQPASNGRSNGTSTSFGPGSVVVAQPRRPATESVGDSLSEQYEVSLSAVKSAWDSRGGNPFRQTD